MTNIKNKATRYKYYDKQPQYKLVYNLKKTYII